MTNNLENFTDVLGDADADEILNSQPLSLSSSGEIYETKQTTQKHDIVDTHSKPIRPQKHTGQQGDFRSVEEIDPKYRDVFSYPYFNMVQSSVIDEALYSDKSMMVCAPTGSGKTVVFEMAIVQLLMDIESKQCTDDFKIIYMAPVKALCTERLTEWYPKFTKLGVLCIEVTGDTDVDFSQLESYKIIITTPEKWDMLTRRWRDHRTLVTLIKLILIDEVHILNEESRGPVLEAVVSRMKTIESSSQSAYRIEQLQNQRSSNAPYPRIRFVAVSATVSNPADVAEWLGSGDTPAVYYKFGDECRPVKVNRVVEGYPRAEGTSIFKFDIILNYKLWPLIQRYHDGKPTLIFCNTRKSVALTAETLSKELTISFTPDQRAKLTALAATIKNKKLQGLVMSGVGCHHAGLLFGERMNIEIAFRNRDLPILITTTTLAMGVNLPAHLVIIKNTQQYVNGAYQEYSISTVLQMVGRAGRPQFDTSATAVIMTQLKDKSRYQALVEGSEPLESYLHKRLPENLNSEAALGSVTDVAQCVQWLRSTFLCVRAAKQPRRYLGVPTDSPPHQVQKKIEELCVKAMNSLASAGLITMDEACCIEPTEAGRLMSIYYLDLETMKHIMKIEGTETLEKLLWVVCCSHELSDMHLRADERRTLNALNRNNAAPTIRYPMKGKISTRQMKLNCVIQAILGCLPIPDPSLNQEATKIMRIAERVCKCLVSYVTRSDLISTQPAHHTTILNALVLAKCIQAQLWESSQYVSRQLKGIGPTFSTLLASAGKVNFMLLEESHPRDLERIMNKGPPAGNIIRKQISLLPKYSLTATPIDEHKVSVQLSLLNVAQLSENVDQLTAGKGHRASVVVGDEDNCLLLFAAFKDKDLMGIYDGTITYEIARKHAYEHKIYVNCISSSFVGIDVQCEYTFKDIQPSYSWGEACSLNPAVEASQNKTIKQTAITDTFKQRKRKNDEDITLSKEKRKRDTSLIEKFKNLKQSFGVTSNKIKDDLNKSAALSNKILKDMYEPENDSTLNAIGFGDINEINYDDQAMGVVTNDDNKNKTHQTMNCNYDAEYPEMNLEDESSSITDEKVDNILNEIESEIYRAKTKVNSSKKITSNPSTNATGNKKRTLQIHSSCFADDNQKNTSTNYRQNRVHTPVAYIKNDSGKRKPSKVSNYRFIDLLERNVDLSDEEETPKKDTGFSDTIKFEIDKFLQKARNDSNETDVLMNKLLSSNIEMIKTTEQEFVELTKDIDNLPAQVIPNNEDKKHIYSNELEGIDLEDAKFSDIYIKSKSDTKPILACDPIVIIDEECTDVVKRKNISGNYVKEIKKEQHESLTNKNKYSNMIHSKNINFKDELDVTDRDLDRKRNLSSIDSNKEMIAVGRSVNLDIDKDHHTTSIVDLTHKKYTNDKIYQNTVEDAKQEMVLVPFVKEIANSSSFLKQNHSEPTKIHVCYPNNNLIPSIQQPILREYTNDNESISLSHTKGVDVPNKQLNISNKWPSFKYNYPTKYGNVQSTHMPKRSTCINKTELVNTYSLSTTQVDVCTKNTAEHQIHIIRKLKVDLDITEIISKRKNQETFNDYQQKAEKFRTNGDFHETQSLENEIKQHNAICYKNKEVNERDSLPVKFKDYLFEKVNNNNANGVIFNEKPNFLANAMKKSPDDKSDTPLDDANLSENNLCKENNKEQDNKLNASTSENKLQSILQNYSKLLKKTNNVIINEPKPAQSIADKIIPSTKRPFSISQIQNLDVPLPNALIVDTSRSQRPTDGDVFTRIKDLEKHAYIQNIESNKLQQFPEEEDLEAHFNVARRPAPNPERNPNDSQTIDDIYDETYEVMLKSISPVLETPHEQADYNIDQSMFDPKMLLQCFRADNHQPEEIIPPPSGFCNESTDSDSPYDTDKINCDDYYHLESQDETHSRAFNHDTSIFEENICNILTPTKEIEMWTSAASEDQTINDKVYNCLDETNTYRYPHFVNNNSCTVMRNNVNPLNRGVHSNMLTKLNQFKYPGKDKFQI